jgi:hypothetical protein
MLRVAWEESAINGVSHAARALRDKRYLLATLWVGITLGFFGITCHLVAQVIKDYLSYPVLTITNVQYERDGLVFPSVTVCNHNPVKCNDLFRLKTQLPELWEASGCSVSAQIETYVQSLINNYQVDFEADQVLVKAMNAFLKDDASGRSPFLTFWVYLYMETKDVQDMMFNERLVIISFNFD